MSKTRKLQLGTDSYETTRESETFLQTVYTTKATSSSQVAVEDPPLRGRKKVTYFTGPVITDRPGNQKNHLQPLTPLVWGFGRYVNISLDLSSSFPNL